MRFLKLHLVHAAKMLALAAGIIAAFNLLLVALVDLLGWLYKVTPILEVAVKGLDARPEESRRRVNIHAATRGIATLAQFCIEWALWGWAFSLIHMLVAYVAYMIAFSLYHMLLYKEVELEGGIIVGDLIIYPERRM